jgi:hypothetical protein
MSPNPISLANLGSIAGITSLARASNGESSDRGLQGL